ncbi:MAG: hypothetical protein KF761_11120 [Salinibacterium sp.]|nr:hypothetical protein [Salinibacterium sp.]
MAKMRLLVFVLAVSLSLVGCTERFGGGPNSLSRSGNDLLVAVCEPIDVREIYGAASGETGRQVFLDLHGEAKVAPETVLKSGVATEGLDGYFEQVDLEKVNTISIKFEGVGKGASWSSIFDSSGPIEIPSEGWLQTSGEVTDDPCR